MLYANIFIQGVPTQCKGLLSVHLHQREQNRGVNNPAAQRGTVGGGGYMALLGESEAQYCSVELMLSMT